MTFSTKRSAILILCSSPVLSSSTKPSALQILLAVQRTGDFILTGSANLLLMKQAAETLAGRAIYLDLPPFCLTEWQDRKGAHLPLESLFVTDFDWREWPDEVGE